MAKKSDRQICSDDFEWVIQRRSVQANFKDLLNPDHDILTPGSKKRLKEIIRQLEEAVDKDHSYGTIMWHAGNIISSMASGFNFYRPKKGKK
jgi:hypothetical protein